MRNFWFNPSNRRHYQIDVSQDLFGDWEIYRKWWGEEKGGNEMRNQFRSRAECEVELKRLEKSRRYHGYKKIE